MADMTRITGVSALMNRLDKLDRAYGDGEALQDNIDRAARITQANIRTEAPYLTGALRRGILAMELPKLKNKPMAVVKANYSPSKGPIARHAHLVNNGHITRGGSHVPANPFFDRGVNRSVGVVRKMITGRLSELVNKAASK